MWQIFKNLRLLALAMLMLTSAVLIAQEESVWDDTSVKKWPAPCQQVEIISSIDGQVQPAWFYKSQSSLPRPLVVSLHTWSGGFDQADTLSWESIKKDYNYIHPHFRGPNNTPQACGSKFAIQDIDDAIAYALENGNVDTSEIHITGVSGGGYSTLLAYMKTSYQVKTFSAWVPISNLVDWYYESVGRANQYAYHMALATTGLDFDRTDYFINEEEARARSPYFMQTPTQEREHSKLYIYAGIHDGYTGSVPVSQSLKFFNKLVRDYDSTNIQSLISTQQMLSLVERRNSDFSHPIRVSRGDIHFQRHFEDKLQLTIFEGNHERINSLALSQLNGSKILVIGDSNGAHANGWVNQLKKLSFDDFIYNTSSSGNTIGFDNNGKKEKNTLRCVNGYLEAASASLSGLDKIVIMLGTNDCKAIFNDSLLIVPQNMRKLIRKIKAHKIFIACQPEIIIISPPPCAGDDKMLPKYHGSSKDIAWLIPQFKEIAEDEACIYIDTYSILLPQWDQLSKDGIHLTSEGQQKLAKLIKQQ